MPGNILELDLYLTAAEFRALPSSLQESYVKKEHQRMVAEGWTPYPSKKMPGMTAWLPPENKNG